MNQPNSITLINESNLNTGIVHKEHGLIHSGFFWHKIFVQNATKYSREFVLRTIMKAVHPLDFIPVCYTIEDGHVTFMLKNCGPAITKMCMLNLTIPYPDSHRNLPPFKLAIALNQAKASEFKIDIERNIQQILQRRYNSKTKTLNLEYFIKDPDLNEFCPLSQPKLLYFVLYLSKDFDIEILNLVGNELETLKSIEAFQGMPAGKGMKVLDLQKNNISQTDELQFLKSLTLTELLLSNNPVCDNLSEMEYVKLIKSIIPNISKIDNMDIPAVGMLAVKRNFLCDPNGLNFVDLFLEHYFTLYDSHNRELLMNMYHQNAMFSITSQYAAGTNDSMSLNRLYIYKKFSRNLKTLSDLSKSHEYIFYGAKNIGNVLKMLPETEHDPCSFTVDLLQFSDKIATLSVGGVFKEPGQSLLESEYFYSFTRTFILAGAANMEFKIVNEMLHVTNASPAQQASAFKVVKIPRPTTIVIQDAKTSSEKNEMVRAFVALTCLLPEWALKCLKEVKFNLKDGLSLFTELFKADKLPAIAFDFSEFENTPRSIASHEPKSQCLGLQTQIQPKSIPKTIPVVKPKNTSTRVQQPTTSQGKIQTSTTQKSQTQKQPPSNVSTPQQTTKEKSKEQQKWTETKVSSTPSVLHQVVIQPQRSKSEQSRESKTESTSTNKPLPPITKPKTVKADISNKNVVELTGPTLIASTQQTKSQGITINLQKNKQAAESEDKEGIATNIDDLKKYVKDVIILKVLEMTPDTPLDEVKVNLQKACEQVLKCYTFALKYYKAIGREFYRFQLYSDARTFLTNAMATVRNHMGEQLYCIFTLFEVQYGEVNVAENMILVIAESFEINNAASFLSKDLPKTNVPFTRKVFGLIAASDLTKDKKDILLKSNIEFEKMFGNVETLKNAQKLYQENSSNNDGKPESGVLPVVQTQQSDSSKVNEEQVETNVAKSTTTAPEINTTKKETSGNVASVKASPKKEIKVSTDVIVVEDDTQVEETNNKNDILFQDFRTRLLMISNLMPPKIAEEEVAEFLKLTNREQISKVGDELLKKYPNEFYIIRIVCKTWQKYSYTQKVAKSLASIRKGFSHDVKILNPLILYLKVREDIDNKQTEAARSKLFKHICISSYVQIVQVFEDLMMDAETNSEHNQFLLKTLKDSTESKQITLAKVKLMVLLYTTFCMRLNLKDSDVLYQKHFADVVHFHPDDIAELEWVKQRRSFYENQKTIPSNLVRSDKSYKSDSVQNRLEEIRMHYFFGLIDKGRHLRNTLPNKITDQGKLQIKLASAYYEALYGHPSVGCTQLRRTNDESINTICIWILCLLRSNSIAGVKERLHQIFANICIIMNPHSQKLLFKYYLLYTSEGVDIFDKKYQFTGHLLF